MGKKWMEIEIRNLNEWNLKKMKFEKKTEIWKKNEISEKIGIWKKWNLETKKNEIWKIFGI